LGAGVSRLMVALGDRQILMICGLATDEHQFSTELRECQLDLLDSRRIGRELGRLAYPGG
jgi:hypothetical protein